VKRRNFLSITATYTGGLLLMPNFLRAYANQATTNLNSERLIFIQLNGGNDGLNTFIPFDDDLYKFYRPTISYSKNDIISKSNGMGFNPFLVNIASIQQNGDLSIVQNVGYPNPNKSHFRSKEIWETGSDSNRFLSNGWLGRFLDVQCNNHQPTAGINLDTIDSLSLKGENPNSITVKNVNQFKTKNNLSDNYLLSGNPQLDFVRKIAQTVQEGSEEIQRALNKSNDEISYPKLELANKLKWIAKLIKGDINSKVFYTSLNGFDTHNNQLGIHKNKLKELDESVFALYNDLKTCNLIENTTIIIFSEFGRRVKDNGSGTDHGTAAPIFIIGGNTKAKTIGPNPDLSNLDNGDLIYKIDFRSVYATLLQNKMNFNPQQIGINSIPLSNLF
jgi:uncharacterized protein (DUF1501 family)